MYGKLAVFLSIFQRVATFPVFCGVNHQKCLNFLFLSEICIYCVMIFEIKNPSAISGDPSKINTVYTPTPTSTLSEKIFITDLAFCFQQIHSNSPPP